MSDYLDRVGACTSRWLLWEGKHDGITRRYIRRLVDLAFLSSELVEAILHGRHSVELTATRLTELDLPLDWTEQRRLLAGYELSISLTKPTRWNAAPVNANDIRWLGR